MTRPLLLVGLALALGACDAGFDGDLDANRPPDTELSVRSADLRDALDDRRLVSTVDVAWSGTDPDGVVLAYDVRAYPVGDGLVAPGPEAGWARTARRDSTLLLPIPFGADVADVAVEVRAVDDAGAVDETPARTVFPILNSPPAFRLIEAEAPADTTWPVVSFAFAASDRDGEANLAAVEVALNDTLAGWTQLPAEATFLTLVADDPAADVTGAQLFVGRGFSNTGVTLPGLRLGADNVLFLRAVDQAGATSPVATFPARDEDGLPLGAFFVRRVTSPVLLVNDYRAVNDDLVLDVAREALALHGTATYDEWDLSATPQSAAAPVFSEALPSTPDPTLRQTLALWDRIYWVSNAVTNRVTGNNLPRAASVLDAFFDGGGRLLVHTPVTLPQSADDVAGNAAIDVLPLGELISLPPGVRFLRAEAGTDVTPGVEVPGTGRALPPLETTLRLQGALPYVTRPDDLVLYTIPFTAVVGRDDQFPWEGSEVMASIRADRRVALFALPLLAGPNPIFAPADGGTEGVTEALAVLLDGLDFPTAAGRLATR